MYLYMYIDRDRIEIKFVLVSAVLIITVRLLGYIELPYIHYISSR